MLSFRYMSNLLAVTQSHAIRHACLVTCQLSTILPDADVFFPLKTRAFHDIEHSRHEIGIAKFALRAIWNQDKLSTRRGVQL